MFISEVVNYLGAWEKLQRDYPVALRDVKDVLLEMSTLRSEFEGKSREVGREEQLVIIAAKFHDLMGRLLRERGWDTNRHLLPGTPPMKIYEIDFSRGGVGVELCLGRVAFAVYSLFVTFPNFARAGGFDLGVLLAPTRALTRRFSGIVGNFESIKTLLTEAPPAQVKYPFALLGFSEADSTVGVIQLTTPLDDFLIGTVGLSLNEMLLLGERPEYDFKLELPDTRKLAQEVCGFANLAGGGVILLGVANSGRVEGVVKCDLDDLQLRVTNVARDSCNPVPRLMFHPFDSADDPGKAVLVIRVEELQSKPCMTQDRVYVRAGPSVRAATPDEIRRLVLG